MAAMALEPALEPAASSPTPPHVNTWFFMCGPLSLTLFLFGLAWNVRVFSRHNLAFDSVLDLRRDEVPTARGLFLFASLLLIVQFSLFLFEWWRRGASFGVDEAHMELLLIGYTVTVGVLMALPFDVLHRKARFFALRRLARCLWPFQHFSLDLPPHPTPFIEVFLADGLTSLSKFFQDACVAWMLLSLSLFTSPGDAYSKAAYASMMKASPLPYVAASMPYVIRATQCLISFQRTSSTNDRFLHLLNTLKYCSSLLVISVGAYPQVMGHAAVRLDQNSLFLFCAVFNSLYSFLWDVIMDWGLGQPNLPKRVKFLRHQLLYKPTAVYYAVIAVDFLLRILWVTKWWDWRHYGLDFKMLSMVAEVARRCVWNVLRVEWQCIKLEILGSKKLSEDSMELEQSLEHMPLMADDDDDDDDDGKDENTGAVVEMTPSPVQKTASPPRLPKTQRQASGGGSNLAEVPEEATIIAPATITVAAFSRPHAGGDAKPVMARSASASTTQHRRPHASSDEVDDSYFPGPLDEV